MYPNQPRSLNLFFLLFASVVACSTEPQEKSNRYGSSLGSKAVPQLPNDLDATGTTKCQEDICEVKLDDRPATGPIAKAPASWCEQAGATKTGGQDLRELLATICKDGSPTQFMLTTLVPNAYQGSGEPQLFAVKPIDNSNRQVTAFFAVAVKMPITADEHFQRIAPADGNVNTEKGKIESQGGTPGSDIKVTPVPSNSDLNWVRGWTIDSSSTTKTKGFPSVNIKIRYTYELDHFQFENAGYMYTSNTKNAVETVKSYQVLNAVLDIDNSGYQIVIAKLAADDKGQAAKVRDAVKALATNLVKFTYLQSTKP